MRILEEGHSGISEGEYQEFLDFYVDKRDFKMLNLALKNIGLTPLKVGPNK